MNKRQVLNTDQICLWQINQEKYQKMNDISEENVEFIILKNIFGRLFGLALFSIYQILISIHYCVFSSQQLLYV